MTAAATRVFISYSTRDAALVTRLISDLKQAGVIVWLDHEQLTPGTSNWTAAVRRGIEQATDVIYAASPDAADSPYVGHELAIARDEFKRRILPFWIRGDNWSRCAPMGYFYHQYSDGRDAAYSAGVRVLLDALGAMPVVATPPAKPQPQPSALVSARPRPASSAQAAAPVTPATARPSPLSMPPEFFPERLLALGFTPQARDGVQWIIPPICLVPAGKFRLGSDQRHDSQAQSNELNRRVVDLPSFEIARFPVTVAEYACFRAATQRKEPQSRLNSLTWQQQLQKLEHPVVNVSWYDAFDYAKWLAGRTGEPWRLLTEAEWEKAARSDPRDPFGPSSERVYPWSEDIWWLNQFSRSRCNTSESGQRGTTPVGWYGPDSPDPHAGRQSGASPCGAEELAGNVWEWLSTCFASDYSTSELAEPRDSTQDRRLRGGSWNFNASYARAAYRYRDRPDDANDDIGFRLVRAFPSAVLTRPANR